MKRYPAETKIEIIRQGAPIGGKMKKYICVYCGKECEPFPSKKEWVHVRVNARSLAGLHVDCAKAVAKVGESIDEYEKDLYKKELEIANKKIELLERECEDAKCNKQDYEKHFKALKIS